MAGESWRQVRAALQEAGVSIYDGLDGRSDLVYDIADIEALLTEDLVGAKWDYPIRTRSKVAKEAVAHALGYPVPSSFKKTQPRFPGQNLDISVQMADNLQIWNEEVDPERRYALIRVLTDGTVARVRVVTGEVIALWDTTGTLTSKYQAKRVDPTQGSKLVSARDTETFMRALAPSTVPAFRRATTSPTSRPEPGSVLAIHHVHDHLLALVGEEFVDPGVTQDRSRGTAVQQLACLTLGLGEYGDVGQFPDVLCQALEVKLQLSPTIDLGLVLPDSTAPAQELGPGLRHADARYSVIYGSRVPDDRIRIDAVVTTTGQDFFTEFQRFEGNVQNRKLQIPLPRDLFESE
jgi:hypothetical protein